MSKTLLAAREKSPKSEIRHTLHAKTCVFKVSALAGAAPRTTTDGPVKINVFQPPGADFQKDLPKKASRRSSGELPGTPRRPQETPRAPQVGSKSRQERSKSRPGAAPERPWRPLGALGPGGPQRPPGPARGLTLSVSSSEVAWFKSLLEKRLRRKAKPAK